MIFRSKLKEDLFHKLRQFIIWYQYVLSKKQIYSVVRTVALTNRTYLKYKHTENHYVSLDLVDSNRSLLFQIGFSFRSLNGSDYVTIDYMDKDGLGSSGTFALEDSEQIVEFLIQLIKFIPSESYSKHYLNVFKNDIRSWLA